MPLGYNVIISYGVERIISEPQTDIGQVGNA